MKTFTRIIIVAVAATFGACHVGPQIDELQMPLSPQGANVSIKVKVGSEHDDKEYGGELLSASADGLLIALKSDGSNGAQMALVPWDIIYVAQATEAKGIRSRVRLQGQTHDDSVDEFRLVSRYPQGLSPALRDALLASFEQADVVIVGR